MQATHLLNNAPAPTALIAQLYTPESLFFNRNHGQIPMVDAQTYRLTLETAHAQYTLTLADLSQLPQHTLSVTLACAGNRRADLHALQPIHDEIIWQDNALSTGLWTGVLLRDVLQLVGADLNGAAHVAFEGLDPAENLSETFGASVPLALALSERVLLAQQLNGEPLSAKRGFPLRNIVAGYIGARSVKWLSRIRIQQEPSPNYFQQRAYRHFAPHISADSADWQNAPMIGEQPLNAVIVTPADDEPLLAEQPFRVRGYAMPQGAHTLTRVELSTDGGHTWQAATLDGAGLAHTWDFWSVTLTLPVGSYELVVRAFDDGGNTQPAQIESVWNFKGYLNNAWHRRVINVR